MVLSSSDFPDVSESLGGIQATKQKLSWKIISRDIYEPRANLFKHRPFAGQAHQCSDDRLLLKIKQKREDTRKIREFGPTLKYCLH